MKTFGVLKKGNVTVRYSTRALSGGGFGIHVLTYRDGSLETEDMNTTPWPTAKVAMVRAARSAAATLEREAA